MKQGCGKGQGRLRRLPAVVQDRALASPLLWAPWVVLEPLTLLLCVLPVGALGTAWVLGHLHTQECSG